MRRIITTLLTTTALITVGCTSGPSGPSIADGGLPVYAIDAPEDIQTLDVMEALHDVLDLPEQADVGTRGADEARIEGGGHRAIAQDRGAGSVLLSYTGPRFDGLDCIDCPLLDDTDTAANAIERSREILDAIGIDTSRVHFTETKRYDYLQWITGTVRVDGAIIDDLTFEFLWSHDYQLTSLTGGLYTVEVIGTVAARPEADARAQAESQIGSQNSIVDFELIYTGGFRDGTLVVAPAYLATTELGTDFTVSAFTGPLPNR